MRENHRKQLPNSMSDRSPSSGSGKNGQPLFEALPRMIYLGQSRSWRHIRHIRLIRSAGFMRPSGSTVGAEGRSMLLLTWEFSGNSSKKVSPNFRNPNMGGGLVEDFDSRVEGSKLKAWALGLGPPGIPFRNFSRSRRNQ